MAKTKKNLYLVTGGAGFIGSHVAETLLKQGARVRVFDNLSTGFLSNIRGLKGDLDFQKGDLRNARACQKAARGVQGIFHIAANRAVLRSVDDPRETNDVNITGTLNVLLAARGAGVKRVVFSSSSSVYGDTKVFPLKEEEKPRPQSPYAASKIMGEYYCSLFSKLYGLETVNLRYFNVFGPRQNPESVYSAVIPIFIDCLLKRVSPEIHWDGRQSRDFTYVDNIVAGNLLAMKKPAAAGEVFNIACQEEYSVLDIFNSLKKIMQVRGVSPVFKPKRAGDVRRTFADVSKARRVLGFKAQTRFYEGLEKTVEWFLSGRKPAGAGR